jgi:hypothetical protein
MIQPSTRPRNRRCFAIKWCKASNSLNSDRIDTMRRHHRMFRLTTTVAFAALLWDAALPLAAMAQPAPPPLPQPGQGRPDLSREDPPARVGRIARLTGTVSFHNQGDTDWTAASLNFPVSSGNTFWTEPAAEAQLEIGGSRIALAGGTEFDVTTLDASGLQAVAGQGEAYIHLRDLAPNESWSVQTPRGLVRLAGQGRYGIVVGTSDQPTLVTVVEGSAQIDGPGVSLQVGGSQTATIIGTDPFQGSVGPALRDGFLTASLDAERPLPPPAVAVPARVATLPGGDDLLRNGNWAEAPSYGQVWYPPVSAGWVPYREGHWAYVAPWGWTWIDDAPWGFAPFHYGRWIQIGPRWAWTPGVAAVAGPPVYAPALVTFIGVGAGIALGAALASGSIGWVPLGPREPFRPWYRASNNYVREVNINHVTNINNQVTINNFVNRGAATSIPAAAMTGSQPVRGVARPVTAQEFAAARPIVGQQPVRPTASTVGVTPALAQRMNLAPAAAFHPAPGPAIRPPAAGATGFARPAFAPAGNPASPAVPQPGQPAPPGTRLGGVGPGGVPTGPRPAQPGVARPEPPVAASRPAAPVTPQPVTPRPVTPQPVTPRPGPGQAITAPRPGAAPVVTPAPAAGLPPVAAPAPRPEPPRAAAPAPRPGVPNVVTQTPRPSPPPVAAPAPRPEPPRIAAPAPAPRVEPQRFVPPAPRLEPPRIAAPAPPPQPQRMAPPAPVRQEAPQRQKRPGEP